jgi:hypothetical protein
MRKLLILPFLALVFYSCDECTNLDCVPSNNTAYVRVLKQPGNSDLIFGPTAIYHPDSIRFYMLSGGDTITYQYQTLKVPGTASDSMLAVTLSPEAFSNVYMELDNQETDTLQVRYERFNTKCCSVITQIDSIQFNNQPMIPATEGIIYLSK